MQSRVARPARQAGQSLQKSDANQWPGPSNIRTFVRCLRLLDLDRLVDWPGITENAFTSKPAQQSLQARIKAVEWSLYRLFEIYDPKETQTVGLYNLSDTRCCLLKRPQKLRPFFPPLAPLQSLNLRAALYRALTELKKNGVLGRDVVLRKTMLDECKGEKFEEVISALALVILRKVCRLRHPDLDLGQIDQMPVERLVPLIIAYRQSLQQRLQQRLEISQRAGAYSAKLELAQIDMERRMEEAQKGFQPVDEKDLRHLSDVVRSAWVGDDRLSDILFDGRTYSASPLFRTSFESSSLGAVDHESIPEAKQNDLAAELEERIGEQENRLKKWKTLYASMKNTRRGGLQPTKSHEPAQNSLSIDFDQHKELRFDSLQTRQTATERLQPYHASVLRNMHEELTALKAFTPTTKVSTAKRDEHRAPYSYPETLEITPYSLANTDTTAIQDQSMIPSSVQEDTMATSATRCEHTPNIHTNDEIQEGDMEAMAPVDAGSMEMSPGIRDSYQDVETTSIHSSPPTGVAIVDEMPLFLDLGDEEKADALPHAKYNLLTSLHERTQASLLPFTLKLSSPDVEDDSTADDESDTSQVLPPLPELSESRGTLLERTRQSMSLLPNPPPKSKGPRHSWVKQPRFSEIFPVNQFETPGKAQSQQSGAWSPRSGSSTPRDKLFSDEADYASVFKSRPRIAVSPSLSPERSTLGLESMLANGAGELELEDSNDSPSRGPVRHG